MRRVVALVVVTTSAGAAKNDFSAASFLKSSVTSAMGSRDFGGLGGGLGGGGISKQPMKVIGAGQGRTGTGSLKTALQRLGLKPYHMKDGVMETPGHMDLWLDYGEAELKAPGSGAAMLARIIEKMGEDGFNATTDMPACYIYDALLAAHPGAKVILSARRSDDAWAASIRATIGRNLDVFGRVPYRWIPLTRRFMSLNRWMWRSFGLSLESEDGGAFDAATGLPAHDALVAAHPKWAARVAETVAKRVAKRVGEDEVEQKLLVFRPEDGYGPLCAFVSSVDPLVKSNCDEVLANNEPYPHVNETAQLKIVYAVFTLISYLAIFAPLCLVVALGWYCCVRPRRRETEKRAAAAAAAAATTTTKPAAARSAAAAAASAAATKKAKRKSKKS